LHRPWWLEAVTGATTLAQEFAKSHGKKVGKVMTTGVISVTEDTPLSEIAALFERRRNDPGLLTGGSVRSLSDWGCKWRNWR
jgi:hypothetical protein